MTAARWQHVREILYAASQLHGSRREQYLAGHCGQGSTLRAEVEALLEALDESGNFLESQPSQPGDSAQIGPYRILGEAGRGGMGIVYRALRDGDYRQMVAIKLVRAELATPALTERFRTERQTLALLNHPNIAGLLDGGTTGDGRPYLVMEWVEGCPIHQYCRQFGLTARQRLQLFLHVCDAVSHAHRSLVVHRDLKPSNILITPEGRPKLLDFGIAKVFRAEEPELQATMTIAGGLALTPEYASPEQVRQDPVTTSTDIYSLGAVLYELLTGAPAHRIDGRSPAAIERAICGDPPPAPSSVAGEVGIPSRELRGDLDNILAKALEKDPARRYRNVDEFAADIRRHLDCQPVSARPASPSYRASRFVRRNKLLVAAVAAVVLALGAGLGAALWQARRARAEQALAEQRFQLARQLAGSVLYEFHDGIRDLQGSLPVQQLLLKRSLEYLDKLSAGARANPALQRDLANGYERIAEVAGAAGLANLGHDREALQTLQKALELRIQVLAADPSSVDSRRELARTHREFVNIGGVGAQQGADHAGAALAIAERLIREQPRDPQIQSDLASSAYEMGLAMTLQSRYPKAISYYRRALTYASHSLPENVALYHKHLGAVLISTNDLTGALAEYQAALSIDEPRAAANSANARAQLDLSYDYSDIGLIFEKLGKLSEGLEQYRKVYRIRSEIAAADPSDARAAAGLASIAWRTANVLSWMGERRRAEGAYIHAVALAESAHAHFAEKLDLAGLAADVSRDFGATYQKQWNSCGKARPRFQRALELYRGAGNTEGVRLTESLLAACGPQ